MKPVEQGGRGLPGALRISRAALQDIVRDKLGMEPAYIPIVGRPGSVSLMPISDAELQHYFARHPEERGGGWRNEATAR